MKITKCSRCGYEIPIGVDICPVCGICLNDVLSDLEKVFAYPTVSVVSIADKKRYQENQTAKRRIFCKICEIEYDSNKYESCPLCELRKRDNKLEEERGHEKQNQIISSGMSSVIYKKGDIIRLGKYEGQPVKWEVLDVDNAKVLLISLEILDIKSYNLGDKGVTWETCSLRNYLNTEFLETVFLADEKKKILRVKNDNFDNPTKAISGGNNTYDKVFCLSFVEVNRYFPRKRDRIAWWKEDISHLLHKRKKGDRWWLRTPGYYVDFAMHIDGSGWINEVGSKVNNSSVRVGIRPALWLKIV